MISRIGLILLVVVSAAIGPSVSMENEKPVQSFTVPGHGTLELGLPESWTAETDLPQDGLPPTITLRPGPTDDLLLMITPFGSPAGDPRFNSPAEVRRFIDDDRRRMAPRAVDRDLPLKAITGPEARGFYFIAKDKAPKPEGWAYAICAVVAVRDLLLTATVLSDTPDSEHVQHALAALRDARQEAEPEPLALSLDAKRWFLLVDLPGFEHMEQRSRADGSRSMLQATNDRTGVTVSVYLDRRPDLDSTEACKSDYWSKASKGGLPKSDVKHVRAGSMDAVHWFLEEAQEPVLNQKHVNAYLYRDGACIDVHLSKVRYDPGDEALFTAVLDSVRFSDLR